jgi:glycosyltransferase 2 family protein
VKKSLLLGFKIIASGGLLWLMLRHVDFKQAEAQMASASAVPIIFAFLMSAAALWLIAWRWQLILGVGGYHAAVRRLLVHTFVGFFFSQALPSTIGGDGARAWLVYRDGASLSQAVRSVLIERLLGLAVLLAFSAAGFPWLLTKLDPGVGLWSAEAFVLLCFALGLLSLWFVQRSEWLNHFRIGRGLRALAADAVAVLGRPKTAVLFGILSFAGHLLGCATVWAIGDAIGAGLSFVDTLIVMPIVFVLIALPISIAGWGVREGVMLVGLGAFGVSANDAVVISVLFGLINLAVGLVGGLVWLLRRENVTWNEMARDRELAPELLGEKAATSSQSPA